MADCFSVWLTSTSWLRNVLIEVYLLLTWQTNAPSTPIIFLQYSPCSPSGQITAFSEWRY
jgi:hypothetical protein